MMRDFARGVMPSLAPGRIAFGLVGDGVLVYDWDAAEPVFRSGGGMRGDPDLSPDGRLVGYFDQRDVGVVIEIASGRVVAELGIVRGNFPIRLRNQSVVYQKDTTGVYERDLATGQERRVGDWLPTGIAYLTPTGYVSNDQNLMTQFPMLNPSVAGDFTAGSLPDVDGRPGVSRGLGVRIGGEFREIDPGVNWLDCRVLAGVLATWSPERGVCRLVTDIRTVQDVVAAFDVPRPVPQPQPTPQPQPLPTPTPAPVPGVPMRYPQEMIDYIERRWAEINPSAQCERIWRDASDEDRRRYDAGQNPELRTKLGDVACHALFGSLAEFVHKTGRTDLRIYDKPGGTEFHFKGDNGEDLSVSEDIIGVIDSTRGVRGWEDVGVNFGGKSPSLSLRKDLIVEPHNDDRYIVPPRSLMLNGSPSPGPTPTPQPQPSAEIEQLRAQVRQLQQENAQLRKQPRATGGSYDETQAMAKRAIEEYAKGELGRQQARDLGNVDHVMPSATVWHLAFRYLREGYTAEQVIADAKSRGEGTVPA